jgi:hypothetical protein
MFGLNLVRRLPSLTSTFRTAVLSHRTLYASPHNGNGGQERILPPLPYAYTPISDPIKRVEIMMPTVTSKISSIFVPEAARHGVKKIIEAPTATHTPLEYLMKVHIRRVFYKSIMRIRREKMNKHKLRKFRKRMLAFIKKQRLRREIKKEKVFRAELLAQIKEAEEFDAEKYVKNVLDTIRDCPRPETREEIRDRIYTLKLRHRRNVEQLPPKFGEDSVYEEYGSIGKIVKK